MSKPEQTKPWLPREFEPGLVSVVIPSFNRASLVPDTVRSVFRQSRRPLEVIVQDDGSTDDSVERLRGLDPPAGVRFEVVAGDNRGACPSRNDGAARSRGEFLMFLDSDDLLTAPALELLAQRLVATGADLAWGPWRNMRVRDGHCELGTPIRRDFGDDWLVDLLHNRWIATCAVLYRREALARVGPWREDVVHDGDFYFNMQLAAAGASLAGIDTLTSYYRQGGGDQLSVKDFRVKAGHTRAVLQAAEDAMDRLGAWTDARRKALAWRYFYTAREVWKQLGDRDLFVDLTDEALRVDPAFRPPNEWYGRIAKLAGYRVAERLAEMRRKLKG